MQQQHRVASTEENILVVRGVQARPFVECHVETDNDGGLQGQCHLALCSSRTQYSIAAASLSLPQTQRPPYCSPHTLACSRTVFALAPSLPGKPFSPTAWLLTRLLKHHIVREALLAHALKNCKPLPSQRARTRLPFSFIFSPQHLAPYLFYVLHISRPPSPTLSRM